MIKFLISATLVIFGLTLFLLGVELGVTPLGYYVGKFMAKSNKIIYVVVFGFIFGLIITIAEPGLMVLANQVSDISQNLLSAKLILIVVSLGLSIFLTFGFLRIFYVVSLFKILLLCYILIFLMSIFVSSEFLAIAFDASGSTTGVMAVPFILSLSYGVANLNSDSQASETDSFGLVSIASVGAIFSVLFLGLFLRNINFNSDIVVGFDNNQAILQSFISAIPNEIKASILAILPLIIVLFLMQKFSLKLKKKEFKKIIIGLIISMLGLFLFMLGTNTGFMESGLIIGKHLVLFKHKFIIVLIAFILGVVTITAEPAVYVLTNQIEEVSGGSVKRKYIIFALALSVGIAVALSVLRILVYNIQLWHYLLPGYIICIALMFICPKLFIGIAFDAGGVATGPITATFIMSFIQGSAFAYEKANVMIDGFGMIAMVALAPIISLQILGILYYKKRGPKNVS